MTAQTIFDQLCAPFPTEYVKWRVGPTNERSKKPDERLEGEPLAYIDARAVMDRFDSVLGPERWQCTYTPGVGASIVCNIGVLIGDEWIWKADGAGPSDTEPEKGALSDAFKRAAVRWGVARYLYDLEVRWVPLDDRKRITKPTMQWLAEQHDKFAKRITA